MESQKKQECLDLVKSRKSCHLCEGLTNPSAFPDFDKDEIGAWSLWQNGLDADILLVGQDWGGVDYFTGHHGVDEDKNPTNKNLTRLFQSIGISVEGPETGKKNPRLFFTNAILCLKPGGLTTPIEKNYATVCSSKFLKPLIDLIEPKVVIGLGTFAYESIAASYDLPILPFMKAVENPDGFLIGKSSRLFPVYHCGAHGWNINRKGPVQIEDWRKIGENLKSGIR
jgi:Uracil DNA glycosylase superfamily